MRNIRNMSAKVYGIDYAVAIDGKPETHHIDLSIASASKQLKAICEFEKVEPIKICVLNVKASTVHYQIPDLTAAIEAGYIIEVQDDDE